MINSNNMKNNKTKTTKTILFASLIAALILPFSGMDFAEAKKSDDKYDKISEKLDREIKKFVEQSEKFSFDSEKMKKENVKLDKKIAELGVSHKTELKNSLVDLLGDKFTTLSDEQKDQMVTYIINEKFKKPLKDKFRNDNAEIKGVVFAGIEILPVANAACNVPVISQFKQLDFDINGVPLIFHGQNDLLSVSKTSISSCLKQYELTFADEDHPVPGVDQAYDAWRITEYGTIQDVEIFYVSENYIFFTGGPGTGSGSQGFLTPVPIHYNTSQGIASSVYVSNTWNHMMGTHNTNTGDTLTTWIM